MAEELDLFSTVFYFISRYEEWQDFVPDAHQRFEAKSSILFIHRIHLAPMVDIWIQQFKQKIQNHFVNIHLPAAQFKLISTIDIDNVFAFQSKGFIRTIGAFAKDILKFDFRNFKERFKVVFLNRKDPFDIYEEIGQFCSKLNIPLIYFFLFKTATKYDRTLNPNSKGILRVFKLIHQTKALIGLHPSYHAAFNKQDFNYEKELLENKAEQKINFSRQHFLRFDIKTTPKIIMEANIKADFTMGFASESGFRAGTSFPFYYYNFETETKTDLLMVPFCTMDGVYTVYQKQSAQEALQSILNMANEIKKVGGYFISVYHERSFYNHLYKDYGDLYKKIHQALK